MFQNDVSEYLSFFQAVSRVKNFEPTSTEELAKYLSISLPASLAGATIEVAKKNHRKGKHSFTITTIKHPYFSWALAFLSQYKCYLICFDHGDHIHCLHICVTCLDSFPGPGCYIHGTYD
jgi:hypothetical protein